MNCETCKNKPRPGTQYEKTACAKCRLAKGLHEDNPTNKGQTHIDIDVLIQKEGDEEFAFAPTVPEESVNDGLYVLMCEFARMDVVTRNIVCWKIANPHGSLQVIADECGISFQAASVRLKNACKAFPRLRAAIHYERRGRDKKGRFLCGHGYGFVRGCKGGPGRPRKIKANL